MTTERFTNRIHALVLIEHLLTDRIQFSCFHNGREFIVSYHADGAEKAAGGGA